MRYTRGPVFPLNKRIFLPNVKQNSEEMKCGRTILGEVHVHQVYIAFGWPAYVERAHWVGPQPLANG